MSDQDNQNESRRGLLFGSLAYAMWGVLPIFFRALEPASPLEILGQRILWSAVFCMMLWGFRREFAWFGKLIRKPRSMLILTLAAYILALNWGVYIYAVSVGNVLESSLGYFINPLMTVLVGVIVLKERMNTLQWTAIALGTMAVIVISIDYGRLPYIALTLAITFTIYGFIKKQIGAGIGAVETMTMESLLLLPFAIGALGYIKLAGDNLTFASEGLSHTFLIIMLGVVTMLPLALFTSAAVRLPLFMIGLLQFLAPIGQFLVAVLIFKEEVPTARWIGFGFVWLALTVLTFDMIRRGTAQRRVRRMAQPVIGSPPA